MPVVEPPVVEPPVAEPPVVEPLVVVGVTAESNVEIPLLIWISCSRLFTCASWVMYSFGSVGCVGSWFFNSFTSSVRKSLLVMSEVLAAAVLELVLEPVPVAAAVAADFAVEPVLLGANELATVCAAASRCENAV
jgi:hypothetical protein